MLIGRSVAVLKKLSAGSPTVNLPKRKTKENPFSGFLREAEDSNRSY